MVRPARIAEAAILTKISFASKGYWHYPKQYYDVWNNELTVSADYIQNNDVHVFEKAGTIVGYYSIVELKDDVVVSGFRIGKGFWLEHMFIEPGSIGKGIGTELFLHLKKRCAIRGISELGILADPNARGFYEKMGCEYMCEVPSTILNRTTPYLRLTLPES